MSNKTILFGIGLTAVIFTASNLDAEDSACRGSHVSKCISNVDGVTFLYQDGNFDFVPVIP